MSTQHPITPPPELVRDWARYQNGQDPEALWFRIATLAARWGADEELKAVCQLLYADLSARFTLSDIRAARRPKPPTLKEQALAKTTAILNDPNRALLTDERETLELNLRALEALT